MKEIIERKLGCSIDEFIENWKKKMISDKKKNWETEERSITWSLTEEDRQYIMDYYKQQTA